MALLAPARDTAIATLDLCRRNVLERCLMKPLLGAPLSSSIMNPSRW
eukprot:CAMPEP_0181304242 /NCGR_PEP_ID=MMETSP1101-20121128/9039_1 /TAXON_ID=46948 /ORGANISM="Rhodomonas abbreviata, Strain Caron Lab Isolate" /LENGTH=46 /DNA_ID= /DNA_START= /DNA_END= /DNA_ORIENTATION=